MDHFTIHKFTEPKNKRQKERIQEAVNIATCLSGCLTEPQGHCMTWDEGLEPSSQEVDMTLIIALRCADGALIASDSRASDTKDVQSQQTKCFRHGRLLDGQDSIAVTAGATVFVKRDRQE